MPGPSLLEIDHDERLEDGTLASALAVCGSSLFLLPPSGEWGDCGCPNWFWFFPCCEQVIERIHRTFFADRCPAGVDVRNIIAAEQRRILAGCRIVFSRIFPVGEANPHLHPLWQIAEQFGATCTNQIDDQVTHVVAYSLGTDKVLPPPPPAAARRRNLRRRYFISVSLFCFSGQLGSFHREIRRLPRMVRNHQLPSASSSSSPRRPPSAGGGAAASNGSLSISQGGGVGPAVPASQRAGLRH